MSSIDQDWIPAARLLRPQGRRGELLADPELDLEIFRTGLRFRLGPETGDPATFPERQLQEGWQPTGRNAGRIVLKLEGVSTISEAEALEGRMLWLRTSDLPPLEPDTFRVRDLVGCSLHNREQRVGIVVDLQFPVAPDGRTRLHDAPDLLAVQPVAGDGTSEETPEPVLVPFVRAWLVEFDLAAKRIVMDLPPGLFDESADASSPAA